MDLTLSEADTEFRDDVRAWLNHNLPADDFEPMDTAEGFEQHRGWERRLFEAGWAVPHWPAEYGGRDCSLIQWLVYEEEYYRAGAPGRVNTNGISLLGPTLFEFGTKAQRDRFLPEMASGAEIWAQAWSEPDSGSDLASLKTTAWRDGDEYVVNGQKAWCSRGAWADWLFCLVRTEPGSQRHRGLSYLLVPADAAGIERREVCRLDGQPMFAEVFFDDCRVPVDNRLGAEGDGWRVAMATASSERGLNLRAPGRFLAGAERLVVLLEKLVDSDVEVDPVLRAQVVDAYVGAEAYRWHVYWKASALMAGEPLGSEASYMKLFWSELDLELHTAALRLLTDRAELVAGPLAEDAGSWISGYLFALAGPIYAGTNEIQRNIIAERVLGLPK